MEQNYLSNRKEIMEKDILDLLERIRDARICLQPEREGYYQGNQCTYPQELLETKDYSCYRKLTDSMTKLISAYFRILQDSKVKETNIFNCLLNSISKEIDDCHTLMSDALKRFNEEQYRCLNDTYIKLINMVSNIERSMPLPKDIRELIKKEDFSKTLKNINDVDINKILSISDNFNTPKFSMIKKNKDEIANYTVNKIVDKLKSAGIDVDNLSTVYCVADHSSQNSRNFYKSDNPIFKGIGVVPICKKCMNDMCFNPDGSFSLVGFKNAISWLEVDYDQKFLSEILNEGFSLINYKKGMILRNKNK